MDGVRGEISRSFTVGDKRTAEDEAVEIRRAVEATSVWKPPSEGRSLGAQAADDAG